MDEVALVVVDWRVFFFRHEAGHQGAYLSALTFLDTANPACNARGSRRAMSSRGKTQDGRGLVGTWGLRTALTFRKVNGRCPPWNLEAQ